MKKYDRIEINPDIMFGKPVIKNTPRRFAARATSRDDAWRDHR